MRKHDLERWHEDPDRARASPRSIAAGWILVGIIAAFMWLGPPAASALGAAAAAVQHELVAEGHVFVRCS